MRCTIRCGAQHPMLHSIQWWTASHLHRQGTPLEAEEQAMQCRGVSDGAVHHSEELSYLGRSSHMLAYGEHGRQDTETRTQRPEKE